MSERRHCHRGRTYLGAQIAFNNLFSTVDCLVRNMSRDGAKVIFSAPVMVPAEFDILIPTRGDSRRARMIWRSETEMGITMVQADLSSVVSIEALRKIKKLETDRDALERRVEELSGPM